MTEVEFAAEVSSLTNENKIKLAAFIVAISEIPDSAGPLASADLSGRSIDQPALRCLISDDP